MGLDRLDNVSLNVANAFVKIYGVETYYKPAASDSLTITFKSDVFCTTDNLKMHALWVYLSTISK
jgi:hypothetical protein